MPKTIQPLFLALALLLAPAAFASEVPFAIETSGPQTSPARTADQNPERGKAKTRAKTRASSGARKQNKSKAQRPVAARVQAEDPELLQRRRAMLERRVAMLKKVMESGRVPEIRKSWGRRPVARKPSPELEFKRLAEQGFGTKYGSRATGSSGKSKGKAKKSSAPKKKSGGARGKSGGGKGKGKGKRR